MPSSPCIYYKISFKSQPSQKVSSLFHFSVCVAVLPPFSSVFRSLWPEGARLLPERTSRRVLPCSQTLTLSFSFSSLAVIRSDSRADCVPQPVLTRPHCTCSLLVHSTVVLYCTWLRTTDGDSVRRHVVFLVRTKPVEPSRKRKRLGRDLIA